MKFLLDHDVPEDLTYLLQALGHEVLRVRDVLPQEAADPVVLQFAHEHGCLLVTCNRDDFIELAERQPHHGIVVIIRRRTRAALTGWDAQIWLTLQAKWDLWHAQRAEGLAESTRTLISS